MELRIEKLAPLVRGLEELRKNKCLDNMAIDEVKELMKPFVEDISWLENKYYQYDEELGYTSYLIYESDDHANAIMLVAWKPGFEITPHNHKTWAVVGTLDGTEENIMWKRIDDESVPGFAEIEEVSRKSCEPGDIIGLGYDAIHSVKNISEKDVAISIHIYGTHFNYTGRSQFDPENKTEKPFIIIQE